MFGRLVRMRADILVSILVSIIVAFIISGVVKLDRIYYNKVVSLNTGLDIVGYPASKDIIRAGSINQIKNAETFTLDFTGSRFIPTGKYRRLSGGGKYARNKLSVWVEAVSGEAYGQFYIAELPSQERIVILLDDQAVSVKDVNTILPIGVVERTIPSAMFKEFKQKYQLTESDWFADMGGNNWRATEIGQKVKSQQSTLWFGTLIGSVLVLQLLFYLLRMGFINQ